MDKLAFQVLDPRGRLVICTEECWDSHIVSRHSFMSARFEAVKIAIAKPTFGIYKDAHYPDRQIYYYRIPGKPRYIKVIVRENSEQLVVVTAYTTDSMKPGEQLLWTQSDAS